MHAVEANRIRKAMAQYEECDAAIEHLHGLIKILDGNKGRPILINFNALGAETIALPAAAQDRVFGAVRESLLHCIGEANRIKNAIECPAGTKPD